MPFVRNSAQPVGLAEKTPWIKIRISGKRFDEKRALYEMVGPLDEPLTYRKDISPGEYVYMSADVKLREITYQRRLGDTGNGVVISEREYTPWIELDRDGRPDLRVRCPAFGTDLKPRLHHLAWYAFYNPQGWTWNVFYPKVSGTSPRYNIDHAGGDPHILRVGRLRLELAMKNAKEGASIRKKYRQSGSRILDHERLKHRRITHGAQLMKKPAALMQLLRRSDGARLVRKRPAGVRRKPASAQ